MTAIPQVLVAMDRGSTQERHAVKLWGVLERKQGFWTTAREKYKGQFVFSSTSAAHLHVGNLLEDRETKKVTDLMA